MHRYYVQAINTIIIPISSIFTIIRYSQTHSEEVEYIEVVFDNINLFEIIPIFKVIKIEMKRQQDT